jgi:polar amino acid transport system substrate-binding protein
MPQLTLKPGVLQAASAFLNPLFEVNIVGKDTGFDIEIMQLISDNLGLVWHPLKYTGDDFNGVFEGL